MASPRTRSRCRPVDDRPGWGASSDPEHAASPAYATVAATPSASLTVRMDDEELGRVRWGDVERDGSADDGRVRIELADPGRNWVHVTVVDDETGQPVPCRVAFRSPAGVPFQPHGHHQHVAQNLGSWHYDVGGDVRLGDRTFAYIDGTCQGWLPRGDVLVDVARGFEYSPLQRRSTSNPANESSRCGSAGPPTWPRRAGGRETHTSTSCPPPAPSSSNAARTSAS